MKSADPDVNQHACLNDGPYNPHPAGSQYGYEISVQWSILKEHKTKFK